MKNTLLACLYVLTAIVGGFVGRFASLMVYQGKDTGNIVMNIFFIAAFGAIFAVFLGVLPQILIRAKKAVKEEGVSGGVHIDTKSWHYRLCDYTFDNVPRNLCLYCWKVFWSPFFIAVACGAILILMCFAIPIRALLYVGYLILKLLVSNEVPRSWKAFEVITDLDQRFDSLGSKKVVVFNASGVDYGPREILGFILLTTCWVAYTCVTIYQWKSTHIRLTAVLVVTIILLILTAIILFRKKQVQEGLSLAMKAAKAKKKKICPKLIFDW